jgi:hypothetical protein
MLRRPANLLRILVMLAMASLVAILIFAPKVVEVQADPPAPVEHYQDLRAVTDAYRKTLLGTAENPVQLPAAPADCTASLALPVESPCAALDGAAQIGAGTCELKTLGDHRVWRVEAPVGFQGDVRCVLGACSSAWVRVAAGVPAADPAISGLWTGASGACSASWPGTAL